MRLITWNCHHGNCDERAAELDNLEADIIVLQECERPVKSDSATCRWLETQNGKYIVALAKIPIALRAQLVDTGADGRITFNDLNDATNAAIVRDSNANTYIDAVDLLADSSSADDFFGWNFRNAADEPFAPNDPRDVLGHGTHVAGTIGAIGNNICGVITHTTGCS